MHLETLSYLVKRITMHYLMDLHFLMQTHSLNYWAIVMLKQMRLATEMLKGLWKQIG